MILLILIHQFNKEAQLTTEIMTDRLREPGNDMRPTAEPVFDMEEFEDELMTAQQYYRFVTIKYEGYDFEGAFRIVKLSVNLGDLMEHHFEYLEDQVREAIGLRLNKNNIVLKTKMEIV